jgi:L-ribulose-5-phosphate 4-epimerase
MMRYADLRRSVCEANQAIVRSGLVVLTFGNVSGADRDAGVIAIKPSGVEYGDLTPESIPIVDLDSGAVVDGSLRPSSDAPTHLVLYRQFDGVQGIVHTHSTYATAWAQAGRAIPCLGTTHADHFRGPVPVTRMLEQAETGDRYEELTGAAIVDLFAALELVPLEVPAALVASHGPFAWGASVPDAVENAVALEAVAALALHTLALNAHVGDIERHLLDRHFLRKHGAAAYYGQP